jgi:transcriptional regulator with XRE-family HTH domain
LILWLYSDKIRQAFGKQSHFELTEHIKPVERSGLWIHPLSIHKGERKVGKMPAVRSAKQGDENPNFRITNNNAIDVHVGRRVRLRRTLLGMSQEQLGEALSITFQQVQKYERGSNRISASRLWDIGQILEVPVSFFYEDMSDDTKDHSPRKMKAADAADVEETPLDPMARRETLELVRAYYQIADTSVRKRITEMVKAVAASLPKA